MGEATYYIRAMFPEEIDEELAERITNFVEEGQAAHEWWQQHRGCDSWGKFWDRFSEKFPLVTKYLGELVGGDCNNAPAWELNFGRKEDLDILPIAFQWDEFQYSCECWHFASWERFAEFLKTEFGALRAGWVSDEELDPYDNVQMR